MPATRSRYRMCGHKGFGGECHRCQQATLLAKALEIKDVTVIRDSGNVKVVSEHKNAISGVEAYEAIREKIAQLKG